MPARGGPLIGGARSQSPTFGLGGERVTAAGCQVLVHGHGLLLGYKQRGPQTWPFPASLRMDCAGMRVQTRIGAGDLFEIPPGRDAYVDGNERAELILFAPREHQH
jgi:hypothetical protein